MGNLRKKILPTQIKHAAFSPQKKSIKQQTSLSLRKKQRFARLKRCFLELFGRNMMQNLLLFLWCRLYFIFNSQVQLINATLGDRGKRQNKTQTREWKNPSCSSLKMDKFFLEKSLWYMKILLSLPCDCSNYREYCFCDFCSFHVSL